MAGLVAAHMLREARLSEASLREHGAIVLSTPIEIEPLQLVNHRGEVFTNEDLEGHWTLAFFGYTSCPDICPTTMRVLSESRRALLDQRGLDVRVLMVSVDPGRDTPERLSEYLEHFSPDFVGVTGTAEALSAFARQLHVASDRVEGDDPASYLVAHSGNIVVLNPRGLYHGVLKMPHRAEGVAAMVDAMVRRF
ncbi:MAG: SCO family protein [Pseudomonadales bacterium]